MAVVLPLVAAFAAGSAGIAAIGAATTIFGTIAAYATVAGAVMTGVGALTGKKDLIKIGGILSLAGGLGTMASGMAGAGAGEVVDAVGGLETAVESTANTGIQAAGAAAPSFAAPAEIAGIPGGAEQLAPTPSLMEGAQQAANAGQPGSFSTQMPSSVPMAPPGPAVPGPIQDYAQGLTMNDMQSFWDRVKGVGNVIKDNPTLAKVGGDALMGMYGPEAEYNNALREQNEYQRSLMERGRANLNRPIRISIGGPK